MQLLEGDIRRQFESKVSNLEESLRKELNYITIQNSFKKGIDDMMQKRGPSFVPKPNEGIEELHIIQICKETFAEEYQKRMVQYQMDLTEEIDQMERAKALLKDERASHKNEILKAINPLHVISRVS